MLVLLLSFTLLLPRRGVAKPCHEFSVQQQMEFRQQLYKDLFQNYLKTVKPIPNKSSTFYNTSALPILVDMSVISVSQLDNLEGTFELNSWFWLWWTDIRLVWDPSNDYCDDLTELALHKPQDMLWLPDIAYWVLRGQPIRTTYDETPAILFHNGTLKWGRGRQDEINCELELRSFPQDVQVCNFTVGSWAQTSKEIMTLPYGYNNNYYKNGLVERQPSNMVIPGADLTVFKQRDTHKVKQVTVSATRVQYFSQEEPWTQVDYSFRIAREPFTYVSTVAWPLVIVTVIAVLTPMYHPTAPGKSTLVVTLLLTLSAIYITASEWVPKLDYPTALSELYSTCLIFSLIAVLEAGTSVYLVTMVRETKHGSLQWHIPMITWALDKCFWHVKIRGIVLRRRIQMLLRRWSDSDDDDGRGDRRDCTPQSERSLPGAASGPPFSVRKEGSQENLPAWDHDDVMEIDPQTTLDTANTNVHNSSISDDDDGLMQTDHTVEEGRNGRTYRSARRDSNRSNFSIVRTESVLERKAQRRRVSTLQKMSYFDTLMTENRGARPDESTIEKLVQLYLGDTSIEIPKSSILQCKKHFILQCAILLDQVMALVLPISFAIYVGIFTKRWNIDWAFGSPPADLEDAPPILTFVPPQF